MNLEINPDNVCELIQKARQFHAKEGVVIPEAPLSTADHSALDVLADHKDDPVYQEFVLLVDDLEPDQQNILVALMWLGRGDYELDEWERALEEAEEQGTLSVAEYLIGTPMVADFLIEGLAAFGYSCDEF